LQFELILFLYFTEYLPELCHNSTSGNSTHGSYVLCWGELLCW